MDECIDDDIFALINEECELNDAWEESINGQDN